MDCSGHSCSSFGRLWVTHCTITLVIMNAVVLNEIIDLEQPCEDLRARRVGTRIGDDCFEHDRRISKNGLSEALIPTQISSYSGIPAAILGHTCHTGLYYQHKSA